MSILPTTSSERAVLRLVRQAQRFGLSVKGWRGVTEAEIMTVESGPELDALVAEKVMGLELFRDRHGNAYVKGDYGLLGNNRPKSYSTNLSDAWKVVEYFNKHGMWWEADGGRFGLPVTFQFSFCKKIVADTLPLAICRAALLVQLSFGCTSDT